MVISFSVFVLLALFLIGAFSYQILWRPARCTGPGSHNFEPRYDMIPGPVAQFEAARKAGLAVTRLNGHINDEQRYIGDVCTWCGEIRKRPE